MKMLTYLPPASAATARAASSMVGCICSLSLRCGLRISRPSSAFVPSSRMTIGALISTRFERLDDPVRDLFALRDAAEDVDEDRAHLRVVVDDLERARHHLGVRAAADVEEVRGLAADLADDVDGRHRETGAVGDDADVAVEPDVLQALVVRGLLALVAHLRRVVLLVVGVTEHRVVVERHLRVERVHAPVRREDQRVDLAEVRVALGVAACRACRGCRPRRRRPSG